MGIITETIVHVIRYFVDKISSHLHQVGLYESVGNVIQVENITPVTPPFTIETLLTSDQYLGNYSGLHQQHETGKRLRWL